MKPQDHHKAIVQQFTLQALPFAQHQAHSTQESFDIISEIARLDITQSVVDAGCGPGLVSCALAPRCREITGVDVTQAMIEEARRRGDEAGLANVHFIQSDISQMPFDENTFDVSLSRYVFHHLENPLYVLGEMVRITRPGGRIVICDAAPAAACRDNYDKFERLRDPSHTSALTLEELVGLGENLNLGEAAIRRYGLPTELDSLIDSSFPEGEKNELRALIADDVSHNAYGFSASEENGTLQITFPITVIGWTKAA